jgi:hypothetical protein
MARLRWSFCRRGRGGATKIRDVDDLFDVALNVTDEVFGDGSYADLNGRP